MSNVTRRRFLAAALAAIGAGAAATWLTRSEADPVAVETTRPKPPTTTTTHTPPSTTTTEPAPPPTTVESPAEPSALPVICRDSWGAAPATGDYITHTIDQITVHHTAVLLAANTDAPARARQHQGYHQSLGWPDLAYHYLVDRNGHIYEGRPVDYVGDTATDYDPTGHLLVCCEGDFNQQEVTAEQYRSLVELLAWGADEFDVDAATIRGHRDVATTSCPGDNLYTFVADGTVADDVGEVITEGARELTMVCGTTGDELVAAIENGSA